MMTLFSNGLVFYEGTFTEADILVCNGKIEKMGKIDSKSFANLNLPNFENIDCKKSHIIPGIVDAHVHLSGGSGERNGFSSQSLPIMVSECVSGGVTTLVGTIGVDTTTKTMTDLIAKVKGYNDAGLTAYAYTGGYDIPPKTITGSVRDDIIFIKEIIGVGEISIADRRAPEPNLDQLARACVDAYVGGMLTGKCGVSHFHVGEGPRRLQSIRDLLERHVILPEKIYLTHIERSPELAEEAIALTKKGCYVDFDMHDRDFARWFSFFKNAGAPMDKMTATSDGGILAPAELWSEIRNCVRKNNLKLEEILPHFTLYPANALQLKSKGRLAEGSDADLVVFNLNDFEIEHVMANGNFFIKNAINLKTQNIKTRRGIGFYGLTEKKEQ